MLCCLVSNPCNMATCSKSSSRWAQLHPLAFRPWEDFQIMELPEIEGLAALPVLGRSFWGDVCLGRLWPLCLDFSLSLEVAVGGHHFYFSRRLLLVVPRREEIGLISALPGQPPTPAVVPCPSCCASQGLPLHLCGWLPVFLALPKPCQPPS